MKRINFGVTVILLLLTGCVEDESAAPESSAPESDILTFEEYEQTVEEIKENVSIGGYQLSDSTNPSDLVVVDSALNPDGSEWLTTSGTEGGASTQTTLFFENEEQTKLITVIFAYTESDLGDRMLYYKVANDYSINENLANGTDIFTFSSNNILVTILQSTEDGQVDEGPQLLAKELIRAMNEI